MTAPTAVVVTRVIASSNWVTSAKNGHHFMESPRPLRYKKQNQATLSRGPWLSLGYLFSELYFRDKKEKSADYFAPSHVCHPKRYIYLPLTWTLPPLSCRAAVAYWMCTDRHTQAGVGVACAGQPPSFTLQQQKRAPTLHN
ncbi:hypothetical protein CBL_08723 [Carabus blaptoides fortunei]